jgi:hypothetical protein
MEKEHSYVREDEFPGRSSQGTLKTGDKTISFSPIMAQNEKGVSRVWCSDQSNNLFLGILRTAIEVDPLDRQTFAMESEHRSHMGWVNEDPDRVEGSQDRASTLPWFIRNQGVPKKARKGDAVDQDHDQEEGGSETEI